MNPLPTKILVPTTADRIPWTENARGVVARLFDFQINASAFLMDAEELEDLQTEDFVNDFDRAFEDFFYQIPKELRWKVFPVEVKNEDATETAPITDVVPMHLGLRAEPATVYSDRAMSFANPKNAFGPILRQLREQKGLSPVQVAERYAQTGFECSEERIIRIENQAEPIKDYELLIFERIFGASEITQFFAQEIEARFGKKETWKPL